MTEPRIWTLSGTGCATLVVGEVLAYGSKVLVVEAQPVAEAIKRFLRGGRVDETLGPVLGALESNTHETTHASEND